MGLLKKFERKAPATIPDRVEDSDGITSMVDAEKAVADTQGDIDAPEQQHHLDPDAERAVVRKMDWRIPPLVGALCRSQSLCPCLYPTLTETGLCRLVGVPGSVQYRVRTGPAGYTYL